MPLNRANNTVFGTLANYAVTSQTDPLQIWYGLNSHSLTINPYGFITGTGNYGTYSPFSPHFDINGNFTVNFAYVTGELQANTLRIGTTNNSENYISFRGTTGDEPGNFTHTFIGERLYGGTESSELLLFKGNDYQGASGPDRIRLFANNHVFDTYASPDAPSGTFETVATHGAARTRMIIKENGNIGIGTITPDTIGNSSTPAMLGIVSNAVGTTGLIVRAIASQTARLQQWQNSAGTVLAEISGGGDLFMSSATRAFFGGSSENAYLNVSTLGNPARQGIIVSGGVSQTGNLQEWKNSSGTTLLSVSPDGYLNKTGTLYIGPILTFADPGIGNETKFIFSKASDGAYLTVKERSVDQTFYEFGMYDNPLDGGDYFQWAAGQWSGPGYGWMPLQIGTNSGKTQTLRFIGEQSVFWSPISTPVNSQYFTYLGTNSANTDFEVAKFTPSNSSLVNINRLESSGSTATFNIDISGYTYASRMGYRITIDAGATTFSYTTYGGDNSSGSAIAINAGNWVTLSNGLKIKIGAGALAGENWSFLAFPTPRVGIGGEPDTSTLGIIRPAATDKGLVIRGSVSQSGSLQEWQDSTGTELARISANGFFYGSSANLINIGTLDTVNVDANQVPLTVVAAASQAADIQQWQDSSYTTIAKIDANGNFKGGVVYQINNQSGTSYTFALSDSKSIVTLTNENNITASIPTNSTAFPVGSSITVVQGGLGQVTIQALTSGTTSVVSNAVTSAAPRLRGAFSSVTLIKVSLEQWLAIGDIY